MRAAWLASAMIEQARLSGSQTGANAPLKPVNGGFQHGW
jgi:hypothetical protein